MCSSVIVHAFFNSWAVLQLKCAEESAGAKRHQSSQETPGWGGAEGSDAAAPDHWPTVRSHTGSQRLVTPLSDMTLSIHACILFISSSVADSMSKVHQCPIVRWCWHFFLTIKETDVFFSCFHYIKAVFYCEGRNETPNTHTWFRRRSSGVRTKLGWGKWRTRSVTHSSSVNVTPSVFHLHLWSTLSEGSNGPIINESLWDASEMMYSASLLWSVSAGKDHTGMSIKLL